jgi:hypothetical protein
MLTYVADERVESDLLAAPDPGVLTYAAVAYVCSRMLTYAAVAAVC